MSADRIAEALAVLEAAEKEAVPGPWRSGVSYHYTRDAEFIAKFRNAAPALLKLARAAARHEPAPPGWRLDPDCDACAALSELAEAVLG